MNKTYTTLIIALAIIVSSFILINGYKNRFESAQTVSVVGKSEVDFESDLVVWEGSYVRKSADLKTTYSSLKADEQLIRTYLKEKGIPDSAIVFSAVNLEQQFKTIYGPNGEAKDNIFSGYALTQTVKIESRDLNRVEQLSREATELIEKGIELNSFPPRYYYTKLSDLKMDLLSKASADAQNRAISITKSVNSSLGKLKKADMGVFQITGKNSTEEYSYGGSYNTSERYKTASITIRMDYLLQ